MWAKRAIAVGFVVALAGCTPASPNSYALAGFPVVGKIVRVEPATMWSGGDAVEDGHIFWLRSDGPEEPDIVFASQIVCPKPIVSEDRYFLTLAYARYGYQVDKAIQRQLTGLIVTSCTRVDPNNSFFRSWRDR